MALHTVLQIEDPDQVKQLISCQCSEIRIGAEFCQHKIPTLKELIENAGIITGAGKQFSVIYPRLSNREMAEVSEQLRHLHQQFPGTNIVANDLGILNRVREEKLTHLHLHLGRQLVSLPGRARPPMPKMMGKENLLSRFADKQLFNKSNLHYSLTLKFLKQTGVCGFEMDFIPETFPQMHIFTREKMRINIHTANVLVSLTRKCHTARYFKKEPGQCGRVCFQGRLKISDHRIGTLYLYGNTLLDFPPINPGDFKGLKIKKKHQEHYSFVIAATRLNNMDSVEKIDEMVDFLKGVFHGRS